MKLLYLSKLALVWGVFGGMAYAVLPTLPETMLETAPLQTPINLTNTAQAQWSNQSWGVPAPTFTSPSQTPNIQTPNTQPTALNPIQYDSRLDTAIFAFLVQGGTLVPLTDGMSVKSGDVVEYHAYLTNRSGERIRSATTTLQIPAGVTLLGDVSPAVYAASVDGVQFSRAPLRTQTAAGIVDIDFGFYKAIRWDIQDIGIDGTAIAKYRARVK